LPDADSRRIKPDLFLVDISDARHERLGAGGSGCAMAGRTAPIIMLSANIGDGLGQPTTDTGHNDSMAKPLNYGQLLDKLGAHLGISWVEDQPAVDMPPAPAAKIISPGADVVGELLALGEIGHVRGIDARLAALADDPRHGPLVAALRQQIETYDFDGYAAILNSVGEHERG
jgi:hypothetical protein